MDQLGERRREWTPTVLYRELNGNATLDRHLVEIASLCIGHLSTCADLVWAIDVIIVLFLVAALRAYFNIAVLATIHRVIVEAGTIRTLQEHLTTCLTDCWL